MKRNENNVLVLIDSETVYNAELLHDAIREALDKNPGYKYLKLEDRVTGAIIILEKA